MGLVQIRSEIFLHIMHTGELDAIPEWLEVHREEVNAMGRWNWTMLHLVAAAEAYGLDIEELPELLLEAGADPHQRVPGPRRRAETPFNIAAPNSPKTGFAMTRHWFGQALQGLGSKGLNDISGSHGSSLAQYIAKWFPDEEIEGEIKRGVAAGMRVDIPNYSGWTPLSAAAATGRLKAVQVLLSYYSGKALAIRSTEVYTATYGGRHVTYPKHATAFDLIQARLDQDPGMKQEMRTALRRCQFVIDPNRSEQAGRSLPVRDLGPR
jgi:hypothetical protein